jgi:hypothetical protein
MVMRGAEMQGRRIIQLTTTQVNVTDSDDTMVALYALCADNTVWFLGDGRWIQITPVIPEEGAEDGDQQ